MTPPLQKACKYLLIRQTQSHIITDVQFHVHITTLHFKKAIWHNQGSCCLNVIFEMTEITIQTNCATPMVSRHDSTPPGPAGWYFAAPPGTREMLGLRLVMHAACHVFYVIIWPA